MDREDFAHQLVAQGLDRGAVAVGGPNLDAHLGGEPVFSGVCGQNARLMQGAGERLFTIGVLAELHAAQGDGGVHVIGRGDEHRVYVAGFLVEELAPVLINFRIGKSFGHVSGAGRVDFRHRHERDATDTGHAGDVPPGPSIGTKGRVADFLARSLPIGGRFPANPWRGESGASGGFQEGAAGRGAFWLHGTQGGRTERQRQWKSAAWMREKATRREVSQIWNRRRGSNHRQRSPRL